MGTNLEFNIWDSILASMKIGYRRIGDSRQVIPGIKIGSSYSEIRQQGITTFTYQSKNEALR